MLRIIAGVVLVGLLLTAAWQATKDCTVSSYVYDDCLWVWFRELLGLPASRFLRAVFLEVVGLTIVAGLYLTVRWVFPGWGRRASPPAGAPTGSESNSRHS